MKIVTYPDGLPIDGPLAPIDQTEIKVKLMAAILVEEQAFDAIDAERALRPHFPIIEIIVHGDNARQYAMQTVVAREMSRP